MRIPITGKRIPYILGSTNIGLPIIKIRWSWGHLFFIMGIPIHGKMIYYTDTGLWFEPHVRQAPALGFGPTKYTIIKSISKRWLEAYRSLPLGCQLQPPLTMTKYYWSLEILILVIGKCPVQQLPGCSCPDTNRNTSSLLLSRCEQKYVFFYCLYITIWNRVIEPTDIVHCFLFFISWLLKRCFTFTYDIQIRCAHRSHSFSQPPVHLCFAEAIKPIAHPKITQILSFSWGFSSKLVFCTP